MLCLVFAQDLLQRPDLVNPRFPLRSLIRGSTKYPAFSATRKQALPGLETDMSLGELALLFLEHTQRSRSRDAVDDTMRRGMGEHDEEPRGAEAMDRMREELMEAKDQQLASKDQQLESTKQKLESKDRELAALRLQVRGLEVYDVDAWGSRVEERSDVEPPAERVRREQDVRMRECEMYQARLVEVKKEHEQEGERRQSATRSAVEAKVKEKLAEVARTFECVCCFETLGEGSVAFSPCGHTYCNRPRCASAQAVECPECRMPVEGRVELFGSLRDVRSALAAGGAMAD